MADSHYLLPQSSEVSPLVLDSVFQAIGPVLARVYLECQCFSHPLPPFSTGILMTKCSPSSFWHYQNRHSLDKLRIAPSCPQLSKFNGKRLLSSTPCESYQFPLRPSPSLPQKMLTDRSHFLASPPTRNICGNTTTTQHSDTEEPKKSSNKLTRRSSIHEQVPQSTIQ